MAFQSETLKSKTFWAGIAAIVAGIGALIMGDIQSGVQGIGAGIITICMRDAVEKSGPADTTTKPQ